jgi:molecular chaperone DnaK
VPQIDVTFDIDANGIVHVSARDKATGNEQKISITNTGGLNKQEIENMKRDAEKFAEEDRKRRELVEIRNNGDAAVYTAEKTLRDAGDKADAANKEKITSGIGALKAALETNDADQIKEKTDALNASVYALSAAMYQQAGSGGGSSSTDGGSSGGGDQGGGGDDNVVDADYEEVK